MKIERVLDLTTKTQRDKDGKLVTTIKVDVKITPVDLAELHSLMEKGVPIYLDVGTRQAQFGKETERPDRGLPGGARDDSPELPLDKTK